jgi:hypothetical protein
MPKTVDCSINGNCGTPECNFPANVEQGCNCFDGIDNDGDGKIDKADLKCAQYYGLTFVGSDEGDWQPYRPCGESIYLDGTAYRVRPEHS